MTILLFRNYKDLYFGQLPSYFIFAQILLRNNAEYCAKFVSLHVQMMRNSLQKKMGKIAQILRNKNFHSAKTQARLCVGPRLLRKNVNSYLIYEHLS